MTPLRLYNTLTRKKEEFTPIRKSKAGFYACGPTVYWFAHIGNLRTYIFNDILRRVLEYNGLRVKHVMNITDVGHLVSDGDSGEDKMEKGAAREGKTTQEIADFYILAFKKDMAALNIKPPNVLCRATDHIAEQIKLIKVLEKKGFTYKIADGIYFNTSRLKDYGALAHLDLAGLKAGARVERVPGKKNPTDFALWKFSPRGVRRRQEWPSPWAPPDSRGKVFGFPGWHIECSAMSQKYLGEQFDIHSGAIDLIPVHHANEIAQSQAAYGKIPAKFWLHGEFLLIDGSKMSKSLGNLITLNKISPPFEPLAFRYLTLTAHYRSQLNLTWESLGGAQNALTNLRETMRELKSAPRENFGLKILFSKIGWGGKETKRLLLATKKCEDEFLAAINDDLDMPKAISILWQLVEDATIPAGVKKALILKFDKIFGLGLDKLNIIPVPAEIKKLAQEREKLRQQKQWFKADILRGKIEKAGWLIEDAPQGFKLKPKPKMIDIEE